MAPMDCPAFLTPRIPTSMEPVLDVPNLMGSSFH